jgi:hypothetical protein
VYSSLIRGIYTPTDTLVVWDGPVYYSTNITILYMNPYTDVLVYRVGSKPTNKQSSRPANNRKT